MIRKSFLTAALLVLMHSIYSRKTAAMDYLPQNQWQDNIIKAQDFLYDNSLASNCIIIGSSLSERLRKDSLAQFYNLSFGGQSIFDGFEILAKKNNPPAFLFVEMNVVLRCGSESFTSPLIADIPYFLKKHMPSLRDEYEPTLVIGNKVAMPVVNWMLKFKPKSSGSTTAKTEASSDGIFEKMLDLQVKSYNINPEDSALDNGMKKLNDWVAYFQKKNVTIIFFELPVDCHLVNLVRARRVRDAFHVSFPSSQFLYLPDMDCSLLKTRDGVHLDGNSAKIYSGFFRREAEKLMGESAKGKNK